MKGDSPWRFDLAEKKLICRSNAQEIYGCDVFCTNKRQLSRRELKQLGVTNLSAIASQSHYGLLTIALRHGSVAEHQQFRFYFQLLAGRKPE
jgi:hypothetical protein